MNGRTTALLIGLLAGAISFTGCESGGSNGKQAAQSDGNTSSEKKDDSSQVAIQAQKAVAGVGRQGQQLAKHSDAQKIISGPAAELLNFRQKAVLEIQIPQALQLFKATEGRLPKSHREFMEKIVQANRLQLPELPEGMVYRFNVERGELWVYPEDEAPPEE